jgi:hypothetical protein
MTRAEADALWKTFRQYFDRDASNGLNENGIGAVALRGQQLDVEFHENTGVLDCHACICPWPGHFDPHLFEELKQRPEKKGGGALTFFNHRLFLSRSYDQLPSVPQFIEDLSALANASVYWDEAVVDNVFLK